MNTLKTILGLVILFGFFFACKKEINPDGCHASIYKYFKLDPEYSQNIPYNGKDTLNFIDTTGNTLTFIGQGIDSNFVSIAKYNSGPACPPDFDNYQYHQYLFKEIDNKDSMKVIHYANKTGYVVSGYEVYFNTCVFSFADPDVANANSNFIYKQRIFNGKLYSDVHFTYTTDRKDTMFYKKEYGFLCFKIGKQSWILNK